MLPPIGQALNCDVMLPPMGQAVGSAQQEAEAAPPEPRASKVSDFDSDHFKLKPTTTENADKLRSRIRQAPDAQKFGLQERLDHLINLVRAPARRRKYAWPETVLAQQGADVSAKLPALAEDRAQVTPANLQTEEVLEGAYVSSDEADTKGHGRANARAV